MDVCNADDCDPDNQSDAHLCDSPLSNNQKHISYRTQHTLIQFTFQMTQNNYQKIGAGFCGTVWAQDLHGPAIKREDGGPSRSLANDFTMHQRALEALNQLPAKHKQFRIPQCYRFITPEDTSWWAENLPLFPPGYSPCNAISSERIPPFPEHIPALLLKKFCPFSPEASRQIMTSASNRACLIRPYIGRQRTYPTGMNVRSRFRGFSLLNFPLHIDQMSELGIPPEDIDCQIGRAHV